jgi:hypothetical protein
MGHLVFGLVELGAAYLLASLAINSGSLWQWTIGFVFLFGFLQNMARIPGASKK